MKEHVMYHIFLPRSTSSAPTTPLMPFLIDIPTMLAVTFYIPFLLLIQPEHIYNVAVNIAASLDLLSLMYK